MSSDTGHHFNSLFLHNHLMKLSLAERDSWWVKFLKYQLDGNSSVKRLIDWAWGKNEHNHLSDESAKLSAIAIAWFLASTNRKLRDSATKALICLLENRIEALIEVIKLFEKVNDPYVIERLFAVGYGCTVRTSQRELLPKLSDYVFNFIFKAQDQVYPHILLRDYARGIIEHSIFLGFNQDIDLSKIRPPYKSLWTEVILSKTDLEEKFDTEDYAELWESVMGFGDFARYTIGTNHYSDEWTGFQKGDTIIDREEVYSSFKEKLSTNQLELLENLNPIISEDSDLTIGFGKHKVSLQTAIGRKSIEELSEFQKAFKNSLSGNLLIEYEQEIEPFLNHNHKIINTGNYFDKRIAQRIIFSRVIELGWKPTLHHQFDKMIGTGRGRNTQPHERIGKKYQWIAYYEYMAKLSDNFIKSSRYDNEIEEYEGPWNPYVRDIDPTMTIKNGAEKKIEKPFDWPADQRLNWNQDCNQWVDSSDDLPDVSNLISVTDHKGEEWLVIEGHPEWTEPLLIGEDRNEKPQKRLWYQIRSLLVSEKHFKKVKDWASKQNIKDRWVPEAPSRYELFYREYYWSHAFQQLLNPYSEDRIPDSTALDSLSEELRSEIFLSVYHFLWEEEFDYSKDQTINMIMPSKRLFDGMNLKFSQNEGEFQNKKGEPICLDPSVNYDSQPSLIIKKEAFLAFLKKEGLKIIWAIQGEKNILGGRTNRNWLEISGIFNLNIKNEIEGETFAKSPEP